MAIHHQNIIPVSGSNDVIRVAHANGPVMYFPDSKGFQPFKAVPGFLCIISAKFQREGIDTLNNASKCLLSVPKIDSLLCIFNGVSVRDGNMEAVQGHLRSRIAFRIHAAGHQNCDTQQNTRDADPNLGLLPFCHIADTSLGISFAEGKGHAGKNPLSGCQTQQACGIICPDLTAQPLDHRFVAAHFHILTGLDKGHPGQRIEPMEAQGKIGQQLDDMVTPADMMMLMLHDITPLLSRDTGGQINSGIQHAHYKGRGDMIRQIDISPEMDGANQIFPQLQVFHHAAQQHDRCSKQPEDTYHSRSGKGAFLLRFLGSTGLHGIFGLYLGLYLNPLCRDIGNAGSQPLRLGDLRFRHFQHRYRRLDGHGAQQSEQHHRPQGIGIDFGSLFQTHPGQQHHSSDYGCCQAHIQNLREKRFHSLTSAFRR